MEQFSKWILGTDNNSLGLFLLGEDPTLRVDNLGFVTEDFCVPRISKWKGLVYQV